MIELAQYRACIGLFQPRCIVTSTNEPEFDADTLHDNYTKFNRDLLYVCLLLWAFAGLILMFGDVKSNSSKISFFNTYYTSLPRDGQLLV